MAQAKDYLDKLELSNLTSFLNIFYIVFLDMVVLSYRMKTCIATETTITDLIPGEYIQSITFYCEKVARSRIHEHTISLRFLGVSGRNLESSQT